MPPFDPDWSPPTGQHEKLGRLDRIACGEPHGRTQLEADWLPFAPGTRRPLPPDGLQPPPDVSGFPWQAADLRRAGEWELVHVLGEYSGRHGAKVAGVAVSPDGRLVASTSRYGVMLQDATSSREVEPLTPSHWTMSQQVRFVDSGLLTTDDNPGDNGDSHGALTLRDLPAGGSTERPLDDLQTPLATDPTAPHLVVADADDVVVLGSKRLETIARFDAQSGPLDAVALRGDLAATAGGGTIRTWTVRTRECLRTLPTEGVVSSLAILPGGERLLVAWATGAVRIVRVAGGTARELLPDGENLRERAALSPCGRRVVCEAAGQLVDLAAGERRPVPPGRTAFVPDSDALIVARGTSVRAVDIRTGAMLWRGPGHHDRIRRLAITPDGESIVTASADGTARLWGLTDRTERAVFAPGAGDLRAMALSPDGTHVLLGADDGTARVQPLPDGPAVRLAPDIPAGMVSVVAWHPDGRHAATGASGELRIWDAATGECLQRFHAERRVPVFSSIAFSADGRHLRYHPGPGGWRTIELATGRETRADIPEGLPGDIGFDPDMTRARDEMTTFAFAPDGRWLVTGTRRGVALVYRRADT